MSRGARWLLSGPCLALAAALGCASTGSYGAGGRYTPSEPAAPAAASQPKLVSAHLTRFGVEREPLDQTTRARMVEGDERSEDRILLVFADELDPLTVDPLVFGVLRADGRRVRPVRAFLAPADESDENRSVTLIGNFGRPEAPPVAVHVLGSLFSEAGEELRGLDADISLPGEPDRLLIVERLEPGERRCPGAGQVLRTYWSDTLTDVGADDLAGITLRVADGRTFTPSEFDDQALREDEQPCEQPFAACLGPSDDNVLDLCVAEAEPIVHVRVSAGLFRDPGGRETAAASVDLSSPPPAGATSGR